MTAPSFHLARMALQPAAVLGGAMLAALLVLTVLDVALRYLLNAPIRGTFELTQLAMVGVVFLGLGQAQARGEHITIDLLHSRLSSRRQAFVDRIARAISVVMTLAIVWQLALYAARSRLGGEVSGVLGLPLHVAVCVAAGGFVLFAVALLSDT